VAKNGKEGLDMAIQDIPDIILTDVMMPVMDGIAMTHQIKTHQLTNHIPVVMLSAKNEIQDRIEGQEQGADAYLGKPFSDRELILTLHNLHRLQQRWKQRYAAVTAAGESSLATAADMPESFAQTVVSSNDAFMQSILDAFEINYPSENFDAIELAAMLNISKAQLYRKISKISDEGVMELLRNYRLQKAIEFLEKNPDISTKEVAFNVGFKEYSHFSASFKKRFGVAPSEWRKSRVGI
jgi:YesN/AraC family two-component response regulator